MTSAPALALIPCSAIDPSPDQNREVFDPAALGELAASIAESGLLQPVRVRESSSAELLGTGGPRYLLIAGERRLRACRDILEWETIPAIVGELEDAGAAVATLAENMIRADPGPLEEARGLAATGLAAGDLAARLGKSTRWIRDRLALLELADDVAHFVQCSQLPIGRAVAMSALDVNRQRLALSAHQSGISPDGFTALVAKLSTEQAQECIFDADSFLSVEEYVVDAENEAAGTRPAPIRDRPCGIAEIAELLEVKPATVHQWRMRDIFPAPDGQVGGSPFWWEPTVLAWARETGRQ